MQVILDSSFARPGSAPIWGGKKGEFRDWTKSTAVKFTYYIKISTGFVDVLRVFSGGLGFWIRLGCQVFFFRSSVDVLVFTTVYDCLVLFSYI